MKTASPASIAARVIALLGFAIVIATPLPFVLDKHLAVDYAAVSPGGDYGVVTAHQPGLSFVEAVGRSRAELAWIAVGVLGLVALAGESMMYRRSIRTRRDVSPGAAVAVFAPLAIAAAVAAYLTYPRAGDDLERGLGMSALLFATFLLVANGASELAACLRRDRGWVEPPEPLRMPGDAAV